MGKKLVRYDDLYICDPEKQPNCKGKDNPEWCGKECFMTRDINKSKVDEHGVNKLTMRQFQKEYKKRNKKEEEDA